MVPRPLSVALDATVISRPALEGDGTFDLVVLDYDAVSEAERARLLERPVPKLLVLSAGAVRSDYPRLFGSHVLSNLLADEADLKVTVSKLLGAPLRGLEPWLGEQVEKVTFELDGSARRHEMFGQAQSFAGTHRAPKRIAESFAEVTDELLTNALYNAPHDASGRVRMTDRKLPVKLLPGETVRVTFAASPQRLGVSVTDPFGTLARERVLDYLAKCFLRGDDQIDTKAGGAGLGLYCAFELLSHFTLDLQPGKQTEAIGVMDLGHSWGQHMGRPKSFNVFTPRET